MKSTFTKFLVFLSYCLSKKSPEFGEHSFHIDCDIKFNINSTYPQVGELVLLLVVRKLLRKKKKISGKTPGKFFWKCR